MSSTDTSANVIQGTVPSQGRDATSLRNARFLTLAWLAVYLACSAAILGVARGNAPLIVLHITLLVVIAWAIPSRSRAAEMVGDLAPLLIAPMLYGEIPRLIAALGTPVHDMLVQHWELAIFGGQPSRTLAGALPSVALSELLHAGYLAYYPAIFIPPLLLYVRGERNGFHQTTLALTVTCTVSWLIFALFPVEGPRYLWAGPANVPHGLFRELATRILATGSARGAAFPSSHMAVTVAQAVMAWRWQRGRVAVALTVIAVLVGVGAVYGGFHYGVDMLAGAALGAAISLTVRRWR